MNGSTADRSAEPESPSASKAVYGIDGCRGGWFFIAMKNATITGWGVVEKLKELVLRASPQDRIFVDIPIGLPEPGDSRPCDKEARKVLGKPRSSSVFPALPRVVLGTKTYDEARQVSLTLTGKSLTKQAFSIRDKIHEVDQLMRGSEKARRIIREVHPEVCFWALNGRKPMEHAKKEPEGRRERLRVLVRHNASARQTFNEARRGSSREELQADDILDALAIAVTGSSDLGTIRTLPANPSQDKEGLPMEMVYSVSGLSARPRPQSRIRAGAALRVGSPARDLEKQRPTPGRNGDVADAGARRGSMVSDRGAKRGQTRSEVLVLDASTFISEVGLSSRKAPALRHYLYRRGTRLMLPKVVVTACERELVQEAMGRRKAALASLGWLSRFLGEVGGWEAPYEAVIAARANTLAHADALKPTLLSDSAEIIRRAEERGRDERPPGHRKDSLNDCIIWEHCLSLLHEHDVIFVSADKADFCGRRVQDRLHPQLRREANEVEGGTLTFFTDVASLLKDIEEPLPKLPTKRLVAFVYESLADKVAQLEDNSGCQPPASAGSAAVEQRFFTTGKDHLVEVRLNLRHPWDGPEDVPLHEFKVRGTCQYDLGSDELSDFSVGRVGLYFKQADGSERATEGSYISVSLPSSHVGAPPIKGNVEVTEIRAKAD